MAAKKAAENDAGLPFPALQLLAPPVRLVSAALWKVLQQRDALRYGAVEEFVTSVCESVPGMLTFRHQGKLTLGLRGRFILELLSRSQDLPDRELIGRHLERFRAPTPSSSTHRPDVKIERTVSCFQELMEALLRDPAERLQFFKEEFPEEYGAKFDQELEKLLWEFLIRLDQLLPVPTLAQTVSWLSTAPPVLEECARSATQPQLLKTILQYQTCLGHLESAASLPPRMGDSILTSLSLPPSGKTSNRPPTANQSSSRSAPATGRQTQATENKPPFIAPVIGLISDKEVPAMISASKNNAKPREDEEEGSERGSRSKRKRPGDSEEEGADVEEEEEDNDEMPVGRGTSNRGRRLKKRSGKNRRQAKRSQSLSDDDDDGPLSRTRRASLAVDPSLRDAAVSSCLLNQPQVLLSKLDGALFATANANTEVAQSGHHRDNSGEQGRSADVCAKKVHQNLNQRRPAAEPPCSDNKENSHVLPGITRSSTITEASPALGDSDDVIGDSEDEATKNFKGMLFVKRYYKTKHDTYVPTLREFWKPWMARPTLLSPR